jgi:hypothetical protein
MTLEHLIAQSSARSDRWMAGVEWLITDWTNQMAGESGETCNAAKKLRRIQSGVANINAQDRHLASEEDAKHKIGLEAADTILSAICVLRAAGCDPIAYLVEAFDLKSEELGFPERLNPNL